MKILFVITKGYWGGAQKYVFDLATNLPKNQFEVVVALGDGDELQRKLEESGIRTIKIEGLARNINPLLEISTLFKLIHIYKQEKPDVVHLNSSKIGGLGALAARIAGIPKIIFTAHGWAFNEKRNFISKSIIIFLSWLTILFSTRIIVLGEKEKNQALRFPLSSGKIVKIYLGLKPLEFKTALEAREYIRERSCIPEEVLGALWVGTISELHTNKGLSYAIEAFTLLDSSVHFFIIGGGEEEQRLMDLVKEKKLTERIHFLGGPTEFKNAATYLKAFDIFLLSSIKEGLPYVILEAGLAKIPVIATHVGAIPEVIKNDESGLLIAPESPLEIKNGISKLITDKELVQELATHLQEKVTKDFSLDTLVQKTIELYKAN